MAADRRLIEFARELRREQTPAEQKRWRLLRNRRLSGFRFRRQHPLGLYIADFYSASAALVIELDGDTHATEEGIEHDRIRTEYMKGLGVEVIRFWNGSVADNADGVVQRIFELCAQRQGMHRHKTPAAHRRERNRVE